MADTDRRPVQLRIPEPVLTRIENCWHRMHLPSRHAAFLLALETGLDALEPHPEHEDQLALFDLDNHGGTA